MTATDPSRRAALPARHLRGDPRDVSAALRKLVAAYSPWPARRSAARMAFCAYDLDETASADTFPAGSIRAPARTDPKPRRGPVRSHATPRARQSCAARRGYPGTGRRGSCRLGSRSARQPPIPRRRTASANPDLLDAVGSVRRRAASCGGRARHRRARQRPESSIRWPRDDHSIATPALASEFCPSQRHGPSSRAISRSVPHAR